MKLGRWTIINIFILVVTGLAFASLRFVPPMPDPNGDIVTLSDRPPVVSAHR